MMKTLFKDNENNTSIKNINVPQIKNDDDVLIHIKYGAICRTDTYVYLNRIHQNNIVLGHEISGSIVDKGRNVQELNIGDFVSVNPFMGCNNCVYCKEHQYQLCPNQKMMGVDIDGLFSEFICVNQFNVYKFEITDFKTIAFFEPVLAISAVLNTSMSINDKILIYGDNRIAKLTQMIMHTKGYKYVDCFIPNDVEPNYDFVIETVPDTYNLNQAIKCLKDNGTLIVKSRIFHEVILDFMYILKHNIKIEPAYYYNNISDVIDMMENKLSWNDLIGDDFHLEEYAKVFEMSLQKESKKSYLRMD